MKFDDSIGRDVDRDVDAENGLKQWRWCDVDSDVDNEIGSDNDENV